MHTQLFGYLKAHWKSIPQEIHMEKDKGNGRYMVSEETTRSGQGFLYSFG